MLKFIDGGVCAAQGFKAAGIHVGVKTHANWKKDVALIVSDVDCAASAVFTKNVVKAAPIHVDKAHLVDGKARAIIANSGNANAQAGKDTLVLYAAGNDEQFTVTALFDNLGKGASGAAVQNMNLMLGFEETTGLNL